MPFKKRRMTTEATRRPTRTGALRKKQTSSQRRNARVVVPRNKLGFPISMTSTVRFVKKFDFAPTSTATAVWSLRANGAYDPDAALGGHQPRGFDEYSELYDTFTVTSSKVSVNWMYEAYDGPTMLDGGHLTQKIDTSDEDIPGLSPVICGIFKSNEVYGSGIPNTEQMEKDRTTWVVMNPQSEPKISTAKSNFSEFFGKQDLVAAEGYSGSASADPANQVYYHIWCSRGSDDYPAGNCKISAYASIEYRIIWTDPKALPAS